MPVPTRQSRLASRTPIATERLTIAVGSSLARDGRFASVGRADQRWVMMAKDILFEIEGC